MRMQGVVVGALLLAGIAQAQAQISVVLPYPTRAAKASSSPGDFAQLGDRTLFVTRAASYGLDLWATGAGLGTPELLWSSQFPYTSMTQLIVARGAVWFTTADGLWTTDGTRAGTRLALPRPLIGDLLAVDDRLIFLQTFSLSAFGGSPYTYRWSETDGTEAGTHLLGEVSAQQLGELRRCGSTIYALSGGYALWATDFTDAGTRLLTDQYADWVCAGGQAFFRHGPSAFTNELWTSDGTPSGTVRVGSVLFGSDHNHLVPSGTRVFFEGTSPDAGREPWVSDGTVAGTRLAADLTPGPNGSFVRDFQGLALDGGAVFPLSASGGGWQLGWTDGQAGARWNDGLPGVASPVPLGFVNGQLVVSATSSAGAELWTAAETSASLLVSGTAAGVWTVPTGAFVSLDTPDAGSELWWTDGTAKGTAMVFDPTPSAVTETLLRHFTAQGVVCAAFSNPFFNAQEYVCLQADAGAPRVVDFQIKGTFEDTPRGLNAFIQAVQPFVTGPLSAARLLADGGFEPIGPLANAFSGEQILETPAGTVFTTGVGIAFEDGGTILVPSDQFEYPQHLALRAGELIVSTPTTLYSMPLVPDASVTRLASPRGISYLTALRSGELVAVDYGDPTAFEYELRAFHPDGGQSSLLYRPDSGTAVSIDYSTPDLAYVSVTNAGGAELWRTDGTAEGTFSLGAQSDPLSFAGDLEEGTLLFFRGSGPQTSVWQTDGTLANTRIVSAGAGSTWVRRIDGTIYTDCWTFDAGYELCALDDDGGLRLVADGFPGPRSSRPRWPVVATKQIVWPAETPAGLTFLALPRSIDAGPDGVDAGTDGGSTASDGGSTTRDAGVSAGQATDAGTDGPSTAHGCGCSTGDALALQGLWLLAAALRRRRRQ